MLEADDISMKYVLHDDDRRANCIAEIQRLPLEPVQCVEIQPYKKTRSLEANARYWSILTELAVGMARQMDGEWHDPEVWHQHFRATFLPCNTLHIDGEDVRIPKSTTKLKTAEFSDFMAQVEAWGVEHGAL